MGTRETRVWSDLANKVSPEVLYAPKTSGDPEQGENWPSVHHRIVTHLEHTVAGSPWINHFALLSIVLIARRFDVATVVNFLGTLHARFKNLFLALHLKSMDDWNADRYISAYLKGEVRPQDSDSLHWNFWRAYSASTKQLHIWAESLPAKKRQIYQPYLLPFVKPEVVQGFTRWRTVRQRQKQVRKTEEDAVMPQFSALRTEAHYRYNRLLRLQQAYQQATSQVSENHSCLPLDFSYDEGDPPQERLHFRLWDQLSFMLNHQDVYTPKMVTLAQEKASDDSDTSTDLLLEFVGAKRLTGEAPAEGFWFEEILRVGLLGRSLQSGSEAEQQQKQRWLAAWGYGSPEEPRATSPFRTQISGLLSWPVAKNHFVFEAQKHTTGVFISVESLCSAATFGLLATNLFTTTGMRCNEAMQTRLSSDCFVRLVMPAPPGATDQAPRVRFSFRLIPKGDRTNTPHDYFIGAETKRLLVTTARMLAQHYQLQTNEPLPSVEFDPSHGRSHRFGKAAYLFQYNHRHLTDEAISACMRFLLHGMIFQTREGKQVVLKPHLLRHSFATHAVQVEKIPLDIVGEWLKQKDLDVTDYYSQPTESMVAEAVDQYLARVAISVHVGKAIQRSPQEVLQLYEQAKGKAGTLADVIGGQCVSHGFCAAKFACVGCPGKVPDPAKRLQLEKHKVWALQQVTYATEEGLLPEAERMRQLARDCETELQEIDAIETYRKDEERAVHIHIETRE
ncbi:MAG TPA: hypothetical protein VFV38_23260 [Ktedonobacteraceae bacterium]|nr:hypothetical protein [Ktedonobacteraceae bacterium]